MNRLYLQFQPDAPLMPDGTAEIPLDWRGVWLGAGMLAAAVTLGAALRKFVRQS